MKTIGKKIKSDQPGTVLGSLADEADKPASQEVKPPNRRKQAVPAESEARMSLPKGALVVMHKSGGLSFSSRTVIVRNDGRIVRSVKAGPERDAAGRRVASRKQPARLTKQQLSQLRITLAQSGLGQASERVGRAAQPPDTYAYEIVGRVGRKVQSAEVFDGSIPEAMRPLIRELNSYLG